MCDLCEAFDTEIAIHGPAQLRRIAKKLQDAVRSGVFHATTPEPSDILGAQTPFSELVLDGVLPDHIDYDFRCNRCGATFSLSVETYHGQGGTWSKL